MTEPTDLKRFDHVHVDGDILVYGICSSHEYTARFDDDLDVAFCHLPGAVSEVESVLDAYRKWFHPKVMRVYFTGTRNFRKGLYPEYKAHRKKVRKPCGYAEIKAQILAAQDQFPGVEDVLEADDYIGIEQTRSLAQGFSSVIISTDKDFKTIPGFKFNPDTLEYMDHTVEQADRNWLVQTLTGDRTDGYPGLEGIGPVRAEKILVDGTWSEVAEAYVQAGHSEEHAVTQARMARILRDGEFEFISKTVKLWSPEHEPRPVA